MKLLEDRPRLAMSAISMIARGKIQCVEQRPLKQITGIDHQIKEKGLFSARSPGMFGLKLLWVYSRQSTVVGAYSRAFAFTGIGGREGGRRKRQRPQSSTVLL